MIPTRRKWLARGIGILILVVAIPFVPAAWHALAYRETWHRPGGRVWVQAGPSSSGQLPTYFVDREKRFGWMPEQESSTLCSWCDEAKHAACPGQVRAMVPVGDAVLFGAAYVCTCQDPKHTPRQN